jgi:membrane-associated phospholipid phosphatase
MTSDRLHYLKILAVCYIAWPILFLSIEYFASKLPPLSDGFPIDSLIPFLPQFVWVYLSFYIMPLFLLLIAKDWHRINRVLFSLFIAHLVAFIMFLNLPMAVEKLDVNDPIYGAIFSYLDALRISPWTNNLPSLHVINAFTIAAGSRRQSLGRPGEILVFTWATLVAASTLFAKQHLVIDVASALVITALSWALAKFLYSKVLVQPLDPRSDLWRLCKLVGPWFFFGLFLMFALTVIHWRFTSDWLAIRNNFPF